MELLGYNNYLISIGNDIAFLSHSADISFSPVPISPSPLLGGLRLLGHAGIAPYFTSLYKLPYEYCSAVRSLFSLLPLMHLWVSSVLS